MLTNIKMCYKIKETGSKVRCFAGFCPHLVTTTSAHTHAYRYLLFEMEQERSINNHFMQEKYKTNSYVRITVRLIFLT